jgi:glycerol-3-phosphate acyltransferase PlsY
MLKTLSFFISTSFFLLSLPACYLLGSFLAAILVARLFNLPDPRQFGSKNPGTTNMARMQHLLPAMLTFFGDSVKGFLPVFLALSLGYSPAAALSLGFAVMLGHMFPLFYNYQGGKGMATAFGVSLALSWQLTLLNGCIWLFVYWVSRISGLASIVSVLTLPFLFLASKTYHPITPMIMTFSALILWMHGHNILALVKNFFGAAAARRIL